MFIRYGELINLEKVEASNWRSRIVAPLVRQGEDGEEIDTISFDWDSENFLYVRARAVTADEANNNGDFFSTAELEKSYKTFIGRGVYLNHNSDFAENSVGIILDAVWHPKEKYIECLMAIDRKNNADVVAKIENGIVNSVSMGCMVQEARCSICGNIATREEEYCEHLAGYMGREYDGMPVYAINEGCNFYELSLVATPADESCHILDKVASSKPHCARAETLRNLQAHFKKYTQQINVGNKGGKMGNKKYSDTELTAIAEALIGKIKKQAQPPAVTPEPVAPVQPPQPAQPAQPKPQAPAGGPPKPAPKPGGDKDDSLEKIEKAVEKLVLDKALTDAVKKVVDSEGLEGKVQRAVTPESIREQVKSIIMTKVPGVDLETPAPTKAPAPKTETPTPSKPGEKLEEKPEEKKPEEKEAPGKEKEPEEKPEEGEKEEAKASLFDRINSVMNKVMNKFSAEEDKPEDKFEEKEEDKREAPEKHDAPKDLGDKDKGEKQVELGDGYAVEDAKAPVEKEMVELKDREEGTGVYAEKAPEGMSSIELVDFYRKKFQIDKKEEEKPEIGGPAPERGLGKGLPMGKGPLGKPSLEIVPIEKEENLKMGKELKISYKMGKGFNDSWLIATKGNLKTVVSLSAILTDEEKNAIAKAEGKELEKKAISSKDEVGKSSTSNKEYDKTKGAPDNTSTVGDEPAQPDAKVKTPKTEVGTAATSNKEYDKTKGKEDGTLKPGGDPIQPADVVKKYADRSKGSIVALSKIWGSLLKRSASVKREAKIAGEGNLAHEDVTKDTKNIREAKPGTVGTQKAHEDTDTKPSGPSGNKGSEMKRYFQGYNAGQLADEGQEQWALKMAALEKQMKKIADEHKRLSIENKLLKNQIVKKAEEVEEEKKAEAVNEIMKIEEGRGAINPDEGEAIKLHTDEGLPMEEARDKSYSNAVEVEREKLASLDLKSLNKMKETLKKFGVDASPEASPETSEEEVPLVYRDQDSSVESEDKEFSKMWAREHTKNV